jgi:hypothetical protein
MADMHLAQLNIGRLRAPIDSPEIAEFADALDRVNALAEASPGFVWRLQTDEGNATSVRPFPDEDVIVNLTVWTSVEALADYVYRTDHTAFLRRRREWFHRMDTPIMVLWWLPAGELPTVVDAVERLDHLTAHGPTAHAFTFRTPFAPDATGTVTPLTADDRDACPA